MISLSASIPFSRIGSWCGGGLLVDLSHVPVTVEGFLIDAMIGGILSDMENNAGNGRKTLRAADEVKSVYMILSGILNWSVRADVC